MKPKLTTTKLHKYYSWQFTFWLFVLIFFTFGFTPLSSAQNQIQIIRLSLNDSISALHAGDKIQIDFRYESEQADIRIFAEPIYKGERNSGFNPFGSPLYKLESGNGTCFIGLASAGKIDSVRIYITDNTKEQKVLYEEYFKVNYRFKNSAKQKRSFVKSAFPGLDTSLYIPPIPDSLIVHSYIDENGKQVNVITIASAPPVDYAMPVEVKQSGFAIEANSVPAYRWSFGCSPTSAAMIAGYYDNHGFPNMYTGPTNGGVMPLTNQVWGTVEINGYIEDQCPLSATMQGLDGRVERGNVDDYWIAYGSAEQDPFLTNGWTEHEYGDCVADFMKTSQSEFDNTDGETSFWYYGDGSTFSQDLDGDGAYGLQLFFESRGYELTRRFNQYIQGYNGNAEGFTFYEYMQEIDAGRPVLIHVQGHTMIGYGYDSNTNLVYLHDTWDYSSHSMTWGGYYDGLAHFGVSVFELELATLFTTLDTTVCESDVPFVWNDQTISEAGEYITNLISSSGQDSVVSLNVSILTVDGFWEDPDFFNRATFLQYGEDTSVQNTGTPLVKSTCETLEVSHTDSVYFDYYPCYFTIFRKWQAKNNGNVILTNEQIIVVTDSIPPTLICRDTILTDSGEIFDASTLTGIEFYDNCLFDTIFLANEYFISNGNSIENCFDTIKREYIARDVYYNFSTCTQTITFPSVNGCPNCQDTVPKMDVNFDNDPGGSFVFDATFPRHGECCASTENLQDTNCISFQVYIDEDATGLSFNVQNPSPAEATYFRIDCGESVQVGDTVCLTGGQYYTLTYCSSGEDQPTYTIRSVSRYSEEHMMLCEWQLPIFWKDELILNAGIYADTTTNFNGCERIELLYLDVLPTDIEKDTLRVCSYEIPLNWNNHIVDSFGVYNFQYLNSDGCDSIIELLVNESDTCIDECPQYFHPVWEGNGVYDPMNIYIIDAKIDEVELEPGDQIGVFDYGRCVGQGVVTQTIDQENILSIIVSADDGTGNGYTPGNQITYKIWNCSAGKEISSVDASCFTNQFVPVECSAFQSGATSFVQLNGTEKVNFVTDFQPGWNIFSMPVLPDSADIEFTFSDLILENNLVKIQDENGDALEDLGQFGGWTNNIGNIRLTEGYKVKVSEYDSLYCSGILPDYPFGIPLNPGWNLIGFPSYSYVNALEVFQQLIDRGTLIKVQNEVGKSIEDLGIYGSWQNFIGNIWAGEGFKVKVASYDTLWIDESYSKSLVTTKSEPKLLHFSKTFAGNGTDHMNFNLVELPTDVLSVGDEIAVYDGNTCVGAVVINADHLNKKLVSLPASAADEGGGPGFTEGHSFSLRIWKSATDSEVEIGTEHISGPGQFTKHESVKLKLEKSGLNEFGNLTGSNPVVTCYPNPFSESVTIEIDCAVESVVSVYIMNQVGQLVETIAEDQILSPGITRFTWDGKNTQQKKVSSGIYFIRIKTGSDHYIEKIIIE